MRVQRTYDGSKETDGWSWPWLPTWFLRGDAPINTGQCGPLGLISLPGKRSPESWAHYPLHCYLGGEAVESTEGSPCHHTAEFLLCLHPTLTRSVCCQLAYLPWPLIPLHPHEWSPAWKHRWKFLVTKFLPSRARLCPGICNRNEKKVACSVKSEAIYVFLLLF